MAVVEFELIGLNESVESIIVDGKSPKVNGNGKGNKCFSIETNKDCIDLIIYKTHYYVGVFWFLWEMLYFIISIFGIFDMYRDKRCLVIDCRYTIAVNNDMKVTLKRVKFENYGLYLEVLGDLDAKEHSNIQYFDEKAQKRHKIMKRIKLVIIIAVIFLIIFLT